MPQTVTVDGPDGKTYDFPAGTTKASAIAYFRRKGIGVAAPKGDVSRAPTGEIGPREPTWGERLKSAVTAGIPYFQERRGEMGRETAPHESLISPEAALSPVEQQRHPVATGLGQVASSLGEAPNALMIAGTWGAGGIPAIGRLTLGRLMGLGFGAPMLYGAYKLIPEIRAAADRGDSSEVKRLLTLGSVQTLLGYLGVRHGLVGGGRQVAVGPTPEAASKVEALKPQAPMEAPAAPPLPEAVKAQAAALPTPEAKVGEGTRAVELAEKPPEEPSRPGGQLDSMRHEAERLESALRDKSAPAEQKEAAQTKLRTLRQSIADLEQPEAQVTPPSVSTTPEPPSPRATLPPDLAGASPRYNYGAKAFTLKFANDLDKAAYILAQDRPSARDADYADFYRRSTGASVAEGRARGREIKSMIKNIARDQKPGEIEVPEYGRHPAREAPVRQLSPEAGVVPLGEIVGDVADFIRREPDPYEQFAQHVLFQRPAEAARGTAITGHAFKEAGRVLDKLPRTEQLNFSYGMEGSMELLMREGLLRDTPLLRTVAAKARETYDHLRDKMQSLDPEVLKFYYDNYWGREWEQPGVLRSIWQRLRSTGAWGGRSLKGRASFLKRRTLVDPVSGDPISMRRAVEEFGMKPVSYNPIDIFLLKTSEMHRFIAGQEILSDLKEAGFKQTFSSPRQVPEGWAQYDSRYAGPNQYGPEGAVTTLNRFMDPGLFSTEKGPLGLSVFKKLQKYNSIYNQSIVSLSPWHLGLETAFSLVGDLANALRSIAAGDFRDVPTFLAGEYSAARNIGRANKFMRAYLEPGSLGEPMERLIQAGLKGGMKPMLSDIYRTDATMAFRKSLLDRSPWGVAKNSLPALLHLLSGPIMRWYVPRVKLISTLMSIQRDFRDLGPDATDAQQRAAFVRSVQSTEDWAGQMDPDNLVVSHRFWNRSFADALSMSFKFIDYSYGTMRGMYGAASDLRLLAQGKLTPRLARVIAFPFMTYMMGSMTQYMMTGQMPSQTDTPTRDGFMPRTGRINPDGTPERIWTPGYLRSALQWNKPVYDILAHGDVVAAREDFKTAVRGRLSGGVDTIIMWLTGKDFMGQAISRPYLESSRPMRVAKVAMDYLLAPIRDMKPMNIRFAEEAARKGEGPAIIAQRLAALQPVPATESRTPAQNKISYFISQQMGDRPLTPEEFTSKQLRSDIRARARMGDYSGIGEAMRSGEISPRQGARLFRSAREDLYGQADTLSPENFLEVWDLADAGEKRQMRQSLMKEWMRLMRGPAVERDRLAPLYNKAMLEVRTP